MSYVAEDVLYRMNRVVISSDMCEDYSFFLPIVSLLWRRRGYRPLVLLVGQPAAWLDVPRRRIEVDHVREVGAEIYWLGDHEGVRTSTVAQVARIFAAAASGVAEDDYLLTSDVDMLPLGLWVGGNREPGKQLQIYYGNAYSQAEYVHFPMCYVGAAARVWKEIVRSTFNDTVAHEVAVRNCGLDDVGAYLAAALKICPKDAGGAWNYDERLLGEMIVRWCGYTEKDWTPGEMGRCQFINRTFVEGEWRIDRSDWDGAMVEVGRRGSLAGVADAHVIRPGWTEENWSRLRPLLEMALTAYQMAWVDDYHAKWMNKEIVL